jgi:23S rRNA (adenine2503-C2)-methyltransferase
MNYVSEFSLISSKRDKAENFLKRLQKKGITATIRRELGADIDAACGQLRLFKMKANDKEY